MTTFPVTHEYVVELDTWMRDPSRIDAYEVRMRVWRDGEYFQFFHVIVPGIDLMTTVQVTGSDPDFQRRFWQWLAVLSVPSIERAISDRRAPGPDPTFAVDVDSDLREAERRALTEEPPVEVTNEGRKVVGRFELSI